MSQWPNNEKEPNPSQWSNEEEPDTSKWPTYIEHGFEMMYDGYIPDEEVQAFSARWGGLDLNIFERVLSEGRGEDRLLAICVIGCSDLPQASTLLLPFLQSSNAKEEQTRYLDAYSKGALARWKRLDQERSQWLAL